MCCLPPNKQLLAEINEQKKQIEQLKKQLHEKDLLLKEKKVIIEHQYKHLNTLFKKIESRKSI